MDRHTTQISLTPQVYGEMISFETVSPETIRVREVPEPMAMRPCLDCGALTGESRCPDCKRADQARRDRARAPRRRRRPPATSAETRRRRETVAEWIARNGIVCPGWRCEPHAVTPPNILTADHIAPHAVTGTDDGPLRVLCRSCNSRRGARPA